MKVEINTITLTLTVEEAYALCNKLEDDALVRHGGFCEFDQIKLLLPIGKALGALVDHAAKDNDLKMDIPAAVRAAAVRVAGKEVES